MATTAFDTINAAGEPEVVGIANKASITTTSDRNELVTRNEL